MSEARFQLAALDLSYTLQAPFSMKYQIELPASPEAVWDLLASLDWPAWFVDFQSLHWLTAAPHGVGSQRKAVLKSATAIERFLVWERGQRLTFAIDAVSLPLVSAMVEDMRLQPTPTGGTVLYYQVFYTPNRLMRLCHPLVRRIYSRMFRQSLLNLQRYLGQAQRRRSLQQLVN